MSWSGTTGFSEEDLADLRLRFGGPSRSPNCIVAANFAIGAVLMMRFAELAAPWFDGVEIIELHQTGQARRAIGHLAADGRTDGRRPDRVGLGRVPARPHRDTGDGGGTRGRRARPGCASTRSGSRGWWPIRR